MKIDKPIKIFDVSGGVLKLAAGDEIDYYNGKIIEGIYVSGEGLTATVLIDYGKAFTIKANDEMYAIIWDAVTYNETVGISFGARATNIRNLGANFT